MYVSNIWLEQVDLLQLSTCRRRVQTKLMINVYAVSGRRSGLLQTNGFMGKGDKLRSIIKQVTERSCFPYFDMALTYDQKQIIYGATRS